MRNDSEYMYASARIRAAEGKDSAKVRLDRMLECRSTDALFRVVLDFGFLAEERMVPATLADVLEFALEDSVVLVKSNVPEPEVYDFLLYKYDCNNIKVAIKSAILGLEYKELYFRCGTFSAEGLADRLKIGDTEGIPAHMAEAIGEAKRDYAATGEGRRIDFALDKACFADIQDKVRSSCVPLFQEYAAAQADIVNITSSVRLAARGSRESAKSILEQAFVPGGNMLLSDFCADSGCLDYDGVWERMQPGGLKDTVKQILDLGESARPEKMFDEYLYRIMNRDRFVPFGVHVPAAFLVNREAEIKNCRILEAGLQAGLVPAVLRERVRMDYV